MKQYFSYIDETNLIQVRLSKGNCFPKAGTKVKVLSVDKLSTAYKEAIEFWQRKITN